ncbi:MAG: GNAT family N-acetyltransferase [Anaerolineae bacterium]
MDVILRTISSDELELYASVPIAFEVNSVLELHPVNDGLGGICLAEKPLAVPYTKDYDLTEKPTDWPLSLDTSRWHFVLAYAGTQVVGAAAVALDTPEIHLLRGHPGLASLWDIRVAPEQRGKGIGTTLFRRAAEWSRGMGCRLLQIETQNINARACRFYHKMGCRLGTIDRYFYLGSPYEHEVCLLWYLSLTE